ncbi:unnamed protein product, partial [Meganyctiphanes norvegica]
MGLPTSCCCGCVTLQNGAKCFSTIRLVTATIVLMLSTEEVLNRRLYKYFKNQKRDASREDIQIFYYGYYGILGVLLLYSVIEMLVSSLQIHGIRKEFHKLLLPNLIWTTFWCMIHGLGFLGLLGIGIFLLVVVHGLELLVGFVIITIFYGSLLVYIISDLLVSLAQYKEMNYCLGLEHIKLKQYVFDDKRRFYVLIQMNID